MTVHAFEAVWPGAVLGRVTSVVRFWPRSVILLMSLH